MAIEQWGSLACHTYCVIGHPFLRSFLKNWDTHTGCQAFHYLFQQQVCCDWGLNPYLLKRGKRCTNWANAVVEYESSKDCWKWSYQTKLLVCKSEYEHTSQKVDWVVCVLTGYHKLVLFLAEQLFHGSLRNKLSIAISSGMHACQNSVGFLICLL